MAEYARMSDKLSKAPVVKRAPRVGGSAGDDTGVGGGPDVPEEVGSNQWIRDQELAIAKAKELKLAMDEVTWTMMDWHEKMGIVAGEFQNLVGGLGETYALYAQNRSIQIDNEQKKGMDKISTEYDAEKKKIEDTVADVAERDRQLKALDEKRARQEEKLSEKIEKKKRKAAHEAAKVQKAMDLAQAVTNQALMITNILSKWAWNSPAALGLIAATGTITAAQIALIAARPLPALAEGGYFSGPALIGESGREFAFPLDGPQGQNAMKEMASGILDALSEKMDRSATVEPSVPKGGGGAGGVYLDGALVGEWLRSGTENGTVQINQRAVV